MARTCSSRAGALGALALAAATCSGCFSERSFPAAQLQRLTPADIPPAPREVSTRTWVAGAHHRFLHLLPPRARDGVTTDHFVVRGNPHPRVLDIYARLGVNRATVDNIFCNLDGIRQTAQVASPPPPAGKPTPDWPGFESIDIRMNDGGVLCARLAPPTARDHGGSYLVITHGLFGSMYGIDVQNHITALRAEGHHVLSLEMRGHGATAVKYPQDTITFGAAEAPDLIAVAHWLKDQRGARRVGLVSFSLTGYEAILAAYLDANGMDELTRQGSRLFLGRGKPEAEPAYNAGMFIVSPPVNFLETGEAFDVPHDFFTGTLKAIFQQRSMERLRTRKGDVETYHMWEFARQEFRHSPLAARYRGDFSEFVRDLVEFIDLQRGDWSVGRRRMEKIRSPLLVLTSANDPLGTAHGVVQLFAGTTNPNLGAVILPQGGHMGFPALSADYYYSLMLNFFDPGTAPRALASPGAPPEK